MRRPKILTHKDIGELPPEHPLVPRIAIRLWARGRVVISGFPLTGKTSIGLSIVKALGKRGTPAYYIDATGLKPSDIIYFVEKMDGLVVLDNLKRPLPISNPKNLQITHVGGSRLSPLPFLWWLRLRGEDGLVEDLSRLNTTDDFNFFLSKNAILLSHLFGQFLLGGGLPKSSHKGIRPAELRRAVVERIPQEYRATFLTFSASPHLSYSEAAQRLGITRQTVAKHVARLREAYILRIIASGAKFKKKLVLPESPIALGINPLLEIAPQKLHLLTYMAYLTGSERMLIRRRYTVPLVTPQGMNIWVASDEEEAQKLAKTASRIGGMVVSLRPCTTKIGENWMIVPGFYAEVLMKNRLGLPPGSLLGELTK